MSNNEKVANKAARGDAVRAVVRALNLMKAMNGKPVWTLQDLHQLTRLPKSTLSRLLATLAGEGYVRWEDTAGTYRLTEKTRELSSGYSEGTHLVDIARPVVLRVTKKIKWPLAMGLLDGDAIVVRFSSMPYSPLAVQTTTLGHRLGLTESAMGRAYLAFCSEVERQSLFDYVLGFALGSTDEWLDWVLRDLKRVRAEGYAVRQPDMTRGSATLALPVLRNSLAIAVLSMTTFGRAMTRATIEKHVPILAATALEIVERFECQEAGKTADVSA